MKQFNWYFSFDNEKSLETVCHLSFPKITLKTITIIHRNVGTIKKTEKMGFEWPFQKTDASLFYRHVIHLTDKSFDNL